MKEIKPGIYTGIQNAEYHGGPGYSKSSLDLVAKSPAHLLEVRAAANDNTPTRAQAIGTAFHELILEPEQFDQHYVRPLNRDDYPNAIEDREVLVGMVEKLNADRLDKLPTGGAKAELVDRILDNQPAETWAADQLSAMKVGELKEIINQLNTDRPGKLKTSGSRHELAEILRENGHEVQLWGDVQARFYASNEGREILSNDDWDMLMCMRQAVFAHPAASWLLSAANNVVVDVKTCDDASPEAFARSIANWRYHVQHPFYLDGLREALKQSGAEPPKAGAAELSAYWIDPETGLLCRCRPDYWRGEPLHFMFLAVEKSACVVNGVAKGVAVYKLREESVELGRDEYRQNLQTVAECERTGRWPGYSHKIEPIDLPAWVFSRAAV